VHSKAKKATKEEIKRMDTISSLGCIACILDGALVVNPGEIHHLIDGGKRIGHHATVSLCSFHHRGIPPDGMSTNEATEMFGPSLALNGRAFRERYKKDAELLAFQNSLLLQPV